MEISYYLRIGVPMSTFTLFNFFNTYVVCDVAINCTIRSAGNWTGDRVGSAEVASSRPSVC